MNPQLHDEFIALCALFFAGELSDEEWALLQVHLAYCDPCRKTFEEFQQIHQAAVPAMAASAAAESGHETAASRFSLENAEKRLMKELDAAPGSRKAPPSNRTRWAIAASLIGVIALSAAWLSLSHVTHTKPAPYLEASIASHPKATPVPAKAKIAVHAEKALPQPAVADATEIRLRNQLRTADERYKQLNVTAKDMQQQLAALQAEVQTTSSERDALRQQLAQAQSEVRTLQVKANAIHSTAQDQKLRLADLQSTVDVLNSSLQQKNRTLALDQQFLKHDRQIRNLIAARHLYIADIYNVKENGATAKPFGRIFYTKDESLVFYAYDLDKQVRRNKLVSYQVWGSGSNQPEVSLGLFSRDGKQKCWILHFDNQRTLARLNKVFVTVEPPGGSSKPTGKQILMAYLRIQPNHP